DRKEFHDYTRGALERNPGIRALAWVPRVKQSARSEFRRRAVDDGLGDYLLHEIAADDERISATSRSEYFPVYYVEPLGGNEAVLGFDLASTAVRRGALEIARDSGAPTATGPLELVQDTDPAPGFLVFQAVYEEGAAGSLLERRRRLHGYTVGVFRVADVVSILHDGEETAWYDLAISDVTEDVARPLHGAPWTAGGASTGPVFSYAVDRDVAGRTWRIVIAATPAYFEGQRDLKSWVILVVGLAFTAMLAALLQGTEDRARRVERLVEERTALLESATERAQDASRAKSEFLANMSHEFRTPLNAIIGFAEELREEDLSVTDREEAVRILGDSGRYLLAMVDDIVDLAKIEAGRLEVERVPFCPATVIAEVMDLMSLRGREKGLPLVQDFDPRIPDTLLSDPVRIRQILVNLVGNAIKFTESGEVRVTASMLAPVERRGLSPVRTGVLALEVSDTGIGMDARQRRAVLGEFVQADASTTRRYGGTGLGLAICHRLATVLGGSIAVESEPGRGTTVRVTVAVATPLPETPGATPTEGRPMELAGGRILVAEDDEACWKSIARILRRAGAAAEWARDGHEAIARVESDGPGLHSFDLVVMDIRMPRLGGIETARRLRSAGFRAPILAVTGDATPQVREAAADAGFDGFVTKPVDRGRLLEEIDRVIRSETASPA
ncbi:MAG TPA: CHASE domain-containing protein, partial [bacterium]|nr:CHASE domain-containing protein [bacterium]